MTQVIAIAVLLAVLFWAVSTGRRVQTQEINRRGR